MVRRGDSIPKGNKLSSHRRNLILIGFMGTGKSSVGRWVARRMKYQFIDTDVLIQELAAKPIPQIFEEEGEEGFRKWEKLVAENHLPPQSAVISTGGGFPLAEGRMKLLKDLGFVAALLASPSEIYNRLKSQNNRPLLQVEDPKLEIQRLLDQREPIYRQAHAEILTDGRSFKDIGEDLIRHL